MLLYKQTDNWEMSLYNKKTKSESLASSLTTGNNFWVLSVKERKYFDFSGNTRNERESESKWVTCWASLHVSFKAHSSGKLFLQNKPTRNVSCLQVLIIIPETCTQWCWVLQEQTRDIKRGVKSKGGLQTDIWQSAEFQKMTNESVISDEASAILETPWIEARF